MANCIYVTAPEGREIPGFGTRKQGEPFDDLPDDVFEQLKTRDGFSVTAPTAGGKSSKKVTNKKTTEKDSET